MKESPTGDRYTDANGIVWERYRDPLVPERANPYHHTAGAWTPALAVKTVDSTHKAG